MAGKKRVLDDITLGDFRTLIRMATATTHGQVANRLGVSRTTPQRRLANLGVWAGRTLHVGTDLTSDGYCLVEMLKPMLEQLDAFRTRPVEIKPRHESVSGRDIKVP